MVNIANVSNLQNEEEKADRETDVYKKRKTVSDFDLERRVGRQRRGEADVRDLQTPEC